MRVVSTPPDLARAVRAARSEAGSAFGDTAIYFERRILNARHIEVQLLADQHGSVIPFVERECSIQRRHQKVIEESPSVVIDPELRRRMADVAASVARAARYTNAGTIEFLVDTDGRFYFLEMNTRLQVEHPVTELVTGLDLVQWQIRIARGERLSIDAEAALTPRGHAIECRIYAEDPDNHFMPSPGRILYLHAPAGPGIRRDSGVQAGFEVPVFYDSMISKLCSWGETRDEAIGRLIRALSEYELRGIKSTIPFFQWILTTSEFVRGEFHTTYLDDELVRRKGEPFVSTPSEAEDIAVLAVAMRSYLRAQHGGVQAQATGSAGGSSAWRAAARRDAIRAS